MFNKSFVQICKSLDALKKERDRINRQIEVLEREKQQEILNSVSNKYTNEENDPLDLPRVRFGT